MFVEAGLEPYRLVIPEPKTRMTLSRPWGGGVRRCFSQRVRPLFELLLDARASSWFIASREAEDCRELAP